MLYPKGPLHQADINEENMKSYRLKGHESFIPREGWLTKGLIAVKEDPKLFSTASGADALGVGTNMAKSIRYWLKTAGLITEHQKNGATLTPVGDVIFRHDPYLEDEFSLWIIHINIARNYAAATSWNVFFNEMNLSRFRRDEMVNVMRDLLFESTGEQQLPERSIRDDCAAILAMYCGDTDENEDPEDKKKSPFSVLSLLGQRGGYYERKDPDNTRIDPLVLLYLMNDAFKQDREGSGTLFGSVLIDALTEKRDMAGKICGLNRIIVNDMLDQLAARGYITVNRTAGLDIVYDNRSLQDHEILEEHFK